MVYIGVICAQQVDEGVWFTRPLTPKILDAASKNVKYLCRLHCVLMEKLLAGMGLYSGIDYYLDSFRELPDDDYEVQRARWMKVKIFLSLLLLYHSRRSLRMPALKPALQAVPMRNPREGTSVVLRDTIRIT